MKYSPTKSDIYDGILYSDIKYIDIKKVLFLDIDGVLCLNHCEDHYDGNIDFDPECVELLNILVKKTDCKIVISSSWRSRDGSWIKNIFKNRGFNYSDNIIGETMRAYHFTQKGIHLPVPRGSEIKSWLEKFVEGPGFRNKEYRYVIFDDSKDMLFSQRDHYINIDSDLGLQEKDVYKAISILNS